MKRRTQYRRQIKRRRETWWWHYLPLHRETIGGHLGPRRSDRRRSLARLCAVHPVQGDLPELTHLTADPGRALLHIG
jgi:hypothetical protein